MTFNWGTGLTIFFILFVGMLGFILYQSRQQDSSLVVDNYYDEDLKYQHRYEQLSNSAASGNQVDITLINSEMVLNLVFPADSLVEISGVLTLYNPAFKSLDKKIPFNLGKTNTLSIPVKEMKKGRYKVKIDWKSSKEFYQETEIIL